MSLRGFSLLMGLGCFIMLLATDGLMAAIWFFQLCGWGLVNICNWPETTHERD